jgi:DNA-binding NarL/FixJ family response regulator
MSGDEERIMAAGCDGYLSKPINKKSLLEKISEFVKICPRILIKVEFQSFDQGSTFNFQPQPQPQPQPSISTSTFNLSQILLHPFVNIICCEP